MVGDGGARPGPLTGPAPNAYPLHPCSSLVCGGAAAQEHLGLMWREPRAMAENAGAAYVMTFRASPILRFWIAAQRNCGLARSRVRSRDI